MISLSNERKAAVEGLLNRLAGVQSARVELSQSGEVERIHVVSTGEISPEHQARNVESALLAALNLELDPRLITVVSLKQDEGPTDTRESAHARERRVRLHQILYQQQGFKITAHAELGWEGQTVRGSFQDTDTAKGRMIAAARATLDALETLTGRRAAFFLEGLDTHQTFERTVIVASLRVVSDVRKADLVGCAIVEEDPNYAAAQAVLMAVNRSFVRLLVPVPTGGNGSRAQSSTSTTGEARERYAMS